MKKTKVFCQFVSVAALVHHQPLTHEYSVMESSRVSGAKTTAWSAQLGRGRRQSTSNYPEGKVVHFVIFNMILTYSL